MIHEVEYYEKSFLRTQQRAEEQLKRKRDIEDRKLISSEIHNSITHAQISLEKLLEKFDAEALHNSKEHIDNIYYHLGAIKGCL